MPMTPEEKRAYKRQWGEKNKEKIRASRKKWYEKNKERVRANMKQQYEADTEKILARHKKYREEHPEENHRINTIGSWKHSGVVHDDYNALYDQYMAATNCADCDVVLGKIGDGSGTFKCLDHCHETGAFRAVVCTGCNTRRGVVDKMLKSEPTELTHLH